MSVAFLRNYTLKINVNEKLEFGLRGDTVRVIAAGCTLYFETKDGSSDFYLVEGEQAVFTKSEFLAIDISHKEATEQTITLAMSQNASIGSAKISGLVTISEFNNAGAIYQNSLSITNVNQTLLIAKAKRKYLLVQNNDASAVLRVTLDGTNATATKGFRVSAGGVLEIPNFQATQAVNAMFETATAAANNVEFVEG